jgi:serine protease Do
VVVAFQGRPIRRADELPRLTARAPVDSVAELTLVREGKALTVKVRLEELPEAPQG